MERTRRIPEKVVVRWSPEERLKCEESFRGRGRVFSLTGEERALFSEGPNGYRAGRLPGETQFGHLLFALSLLICRRG